MPTILEDSVAGLPKRRRLGAKAGARGVCAAPGILGKLRPWVFGKSSVQEDRILLHSGLTSGRDGRWRAEVNKMCTLSGRLTQFGKD